jgi:hypothetical protein
MITVAGPVVACSLILRLGGEADDVAGHQPGHDRPPDAQVVHAVDAAEQATADEEGGDGDEHAAAVHARAQGVKQLSHGRVGLGTNHEDADDGKDRAHAGNGHGGREQLHAVADELGRVHTHQCRRRGDAQRAGRQDRSAVALEQVSAHAGHVADVIPDVVSDGGGIARVVLGDAGLDLADEVGADVGGLGIDAATDTSKERLAAGAHAEGQHHHGHLEQADVELTREECAEPVRAQPRQGFGKDEEPCHDVQQPEADDDQPHHRPAAEGDDQAVVERASCAGGRAMAGVGGGLHAQEATQAAPEPAGQKGNEHHAVLSVKDEGHDGQDDAHHHEEQGHHLVLPPKVGVSPFADVGGDGLHLLVTFVGLHHAVVKGVGRQQGQHGSDRRHPPQTAGQWHALNVRSALRSPFGLGGQGGHGQAAKDEQSYQQGPQHRSSQVVR